MASNSLCTVVKHHQHQHHHHHHQDSPHSGESCRSADSIGILATATSPPPLPLPPSLTTSSSNPSSQHHHAHQQQQQQQHHHQHQHRHHSSSHHRHRSQQRSSSSTTNTSSGGGTGHCGVSSNIGTSNIMSSIIRADTGWFQRKINLRPALRGCHLVTDEVLKQVPEISQFQVGVCHLHIMHTSASLTLNENWDPDVREDMEMFLTSFVPETMPFRHICEGPDDMPAHVKACFLGTSLSLPITEGKLCLGTWQGIWLCEHRNNAGSRKIMVTINGALKG